MLHAIHDTDRTDPDYVLETIRFHIDVFNHNSDECEYEDCAYCSWDNYDSWRLLVLFTSSLDTWMSSRGRRPRAWTPHRR